MIKKSFLHVLFALGLLILVAGCGQQGVSEAPDPDPAEEAGVDTETTEVEEETIETGDGEEASGSETSDVEWTGSLVIAKTDEPNSIDPHVHDGWYSVRTHSAVYETLVEMVWDPENEELTIEPLLAEDWEVSDDNLTYTFYLREGITFQDGTPFTSESVKATFERNAELGMRASWQVEPIESIEAPDDYTVVITLSEPFTPFLMAMSRAYIMNHELIESQDQGDNAQEYFNENMNGTGPYEFVRWDRESIVEFAAYTDYWRGWDGKHFERIILRHVPEPGTQRLLMEQGEVDFALQIQPEDVAALESVPGVVILEGPSTANFDFAYKIRGVLEDKLVRQALAYTFPYDEAIEALRSGLAQRVYGPFPDGVMGNTEEGLIQYDYDLDRARELLEEAGWTDTDGDGLLDKDGEPLSVEVWTVSAVPYEAEAALLWQDPLSDVGVEMNLVEQTSVSTFLNATFNYDSPHDILAWVMSMFIPDPHDTARRYHTDSWEGVNNSFYGNEEIDAIIDEGARMPNGPEREAHYEELQRIINEDAPHVWVWQERKLIVYQDDIQGYVYNPTDYIREFNYYDMYREE